MDNFKLLVNTNNIGSVDETATIEKSIEVPYYKNTTTFIYNCKKRGLAKIDQILIRLSFDSLNQSKWAFRVVIKHCNSITFFYRLFHIISTTTKIQNYIEIFKNNTVKLAFYLILLQIKELFKMDFRLNLSRHQFTLKRHSNVRLG